MRLVPILVASLQLVACSAPGEPVLSWSGYGPVNFGASLKDVEASLGVKSESPGKSDPGCMYVRFPALSRARFTVENGIVTRADVDPGVPNSAGVAVGATLTEVEARHPTALMQPHKYDPEGHYLILTSPDATRALVLEESDGKITKIRAGVQPSVSYVEGCS